MLREFMYPLVTLCVMAIAGIAGLDKLCLFHQTYQAMALRLESERWLLEQCSDPHFFSRMHTHSDLCFQVESNARVGAFMLALRELTQSILPQQFFLGQLLTSFHNHLLSWPVLGVLGALLLLAPSWLASVVSSARIIPTHHSHPLLPPSCGKHWPECAEGHFKEA